MRLMLKVQSGDATAPTIWLSSGQTLTVGRTDAANYVVSSDLLLSRIHFKITVDAEACSICDLQSSNGTFRDGQRITAAQLHDGDQIHAGQTVFLVNVEATPKDASGAPIPLVSVTATACPSGVFQFQVSEPESPPRDVIRRLAEVVPLSLIVDFTKLGLRPPPLPQPVYLLDWISRSVAPRLSPVFLPAGAEIDSMLKLVDQAWGQDAVVLIYSKWETPRLLAHLRATARGQHHATAVPVPQHMFGACHPSMVGPVVANSSPKFAQFLFTGVDALLFESPSSTWDLLATAQFANVFGKAGFTVNDFDATPPALITSTTDAASAGQVKSQSSKDIDVRATMEMSPDVFTLPSPEHPQGERDEFVIRAGTIAVLDVIAGPAVGQRIQVGIGESFSVGRSEQNDQAFPIDLAMSSRHFQIGFIEGELTVHDLASRNGIFVNGIPCKRAVICAGDRLIAGDSVFQVRFEVLRPEQDSLKFVETVTEIS